jgi:hypothetical protein
MPVEPADFPVCPHECLWEPQKDSVRATAGGYPDEYPDVYPGDPVGGKANDGTEPSATPQRLVKLFLDPKSAVWVEQAWGIAVDRQSFLVMGSAYDMKRIVVGDTLTYDGMVLRIESKPMIYPAFDGFSHGETIAVRKQTGGRQ